MEELFNQLADKWTLIYAVIAVVFTEALMRTTKESVTRWRYAIGSTFLVAVALSMAHSLEQPDITLMQGLARGIKSFIIGIAGYDIFKSAMLNVPFLSKLMVEKKEV